MNESWAKDFDLIWAEFNGSNPSRRSQETEAINLIIFIGFFGEIDGPNVVGIFLGLPQR